MTAIDDRAFIIGNGLSRQQFNLHWLTGKGTIYGCNALYRDFNPDVLVAIDDGVIQEVLESNFPRDKFYVPPHDEQFEPATYNPFRPRENAGMVAMRHAIRAGKKTLYLFGMDFILNDYDKNLGNLYTGTKNYDSRTKTSYEDTVRRLLYFEWFANQNPGVRFFFVFKRGLISIHKIKTNNVIGCYFDSLEALFREEERALTAPEQ